MKEKKMVIEIDCSASRLFNFLLDPANTPLWVKSIVHEEKNESPPRVGTEYTNTNELGIDSTYEIVRLEINRMFELGQKDGLYHVRYTFEPVSDKRTRLVYFEWVDKGELEEPFHVGYLEKLKEILER